MKIFANLRPRIWTSQDKDCDLLSLTWSKLFFKLSIFLALILRLEIKNKWQIIVKLTFEDSNICKKNVMKWNENKTYNKSERMSRKICFSSLEALHYITPHVARRVSCHTQISFIFPSLIPVYNQHPLLLRELVCEKFSAWKQWIRFLRVPRKDFEDKKQKHFQKLFISVTKTSCHKQGQTKKTDKISPALFVSILLLPVKCCRKKFSQKNIQEQRPKKRMKNMFNGIFRMMENSLVVVKNIRYKIWVQDKHNQKARTSKTREKEKKKKRKNQFC